MKQILSLLTLILASLTYSTAQVIPNGNFESWIPSPGAWSEIPEGWSTQNSQLFQSQYKEADACEGEYAMKLSPMPAIETIMGTSTLKFPNTAIPPALNFCVKTNIDSDEFFTDTCRVIISFFNAGNEFYSEEWVNSVSITDWTEVSIPLNQIEPLMDSCHIEVQASFPGIGLGSGSLETWISVDNFMFDSANSIERINQSVEFKVYPNPSNNGSFKISSHDQLGEIIIYDLLGNIVEKTTEESSEFTSKLELSSGLFFIKVLGQTKSLMVR